VLTSVARRSNRLTQNAVTVSPDNAEPDINKRTRTADRRQMTDHIRMAGYQGERSVHTRAVRIMIEALLKEAGGQVGVAFESDITERGCKAAAEDCARPTKGCTGMCRSVPREFHSILSGILVLVIGMTIGRGRWSLPVQPVLGIGQVVPGLSHAFEPGAVWAGDCLSRQLLAILCVFTHLFGVRHCDLLSPFRAPTAKRSCGSTARDEIR
jgi:hypothetical protein